MAMGPRPATAGITTARRTLEFVGSLLLALGCTRNGVASPDPAVDRTGAVADAGTGGAHVGGDGNSGGADAADARASAAGGGLAGMVADPSEAGAGAAGGGSGGAVAERDAAPEAGDAASSDGEGNRFDGPPGEWVWVDVPGSRCGDGSETGIAYNRGTEPRVLIYLEAGGVCPDAHCTSSPHYVWTGYDEADFREALSGDAAARVQFGKPGMNVTAAGLFDRAHPVNPFRGWSFVYVPYCTGDYFIGDSEVQYPGHLMHFHGATNVRLFFAAIAAGLPDVERAFLVGGSAGSIGAMMSYERLLDAYPGKRVDLASDSLNLIAGYGNKPEFRYPDTNPQVPPGCMTCASDYKTIYDHNARLAAAVGGRVAILEARGNFTLLPACLLQGCDYVQGLRNLGAYLDPMPNVKYYIADNAAHVLSQYPLDAPFIAAREPVARSLQADIHFLSEFLGRMVNDDPGWRSISVLRSDSLPCATRCGGRTCGEDACGGVCGTCAAEQVCDAAVVGGWCTP